MKIANGEYEGQEELAVVSEAGIYRASTLAKSSRKTSSPVMTMADVLAGGDKALDGLRSDVEWAKRSGMAPDGEPEIWCPPTSRPDKVICVGLNYRPHIAESGMELPSHPVLFPKFGNSLVGHQTRVHPPIEAHQMDYEAELVIVIGRRCANVSEAEALHYVLGYCNGNDLSARDLQFRTSQWLLGKACQGFGPMGPYLVTTDEMQDPSHLNIVARRNGKTVQHSNTDQMIFSCRYLIAYLSHFMTLEPGDVIFTGTPEGVILGHPEKARQWLQDGDTVTVEIEGLGELVTEIGAAQEPSGR